ncbi:Rieske (2Fe-2S) protein [Congregibacter litoralis]|uniref:Ferredoxin subunit of nitrite reductase and ring-hydroxylating dioxygenase n=1 Tax=Congregibacter litoralis KT71 TaxID=314285 RepID=A4AA07_9GAMM|nr:Rieske 2Fe-2S domain-containing protein [Congregibacter litoralis]EAQ97324.1 Ferredoxin subunit of nitrite reductase and ring-hydroxylating dioxygenase [Congregibacter litoralis KT71]
MNDPETNSPVEEMTDNSSQSVTLEGRSLILVKRRDEFFLFENNCPHTRETLDPLGGSLSDDSGDLIHCQRHGAEFLVQTGECVGGPCMGESLTPVAFTIAAGQIYLD